MIIGAPIPKVVGIKEWAMASVITEDHKVTAVAR